MISTITLDTYKQQIGSGDAFNLSDSFNGRVGDEQVPLVVQFKERGLPQQFDDGLVPFMTGFVGSLDENSQVTAETGEAVSYVGTSDDIVGLGRVKMNLPGTMFPQEGYFYGFLGLQNADGKRVTTFNVWFRVYNGNPDMFVNKAPFRTELQKVIDAFNDLLASSKGTFSASMNDWKQQVTALLTDLNGDYAKVQTTVNLIQQQLTTLENQIKSDGLMTQKDLTNAMQTLHQQFDEPLKQATQSTMVDTDVNGFVIKPFFDSAITNISNNIDTSKFNVGFITDTHWEPAPIVYGRSDLSLHHLANMMAIEGKLNAIIAGGDNTNSYSLSRLYIKNYAKIFGRDLLTTGGKADKFALIGNHDDGSLRGEKLGHDLKPDDILQIQDFNEVYNFSNQFGEVREADSPWFYKDYPDKKIRIIGLNTQDVDDTVTDAVGNLKYKRQWTFAYRQAQFDFLTKKALIVPADYSVMIFGHAPLKNDGSYGANGEDGIWINNNIMIGLLNAFISGTAYQGSSATEDFKVTVNADFAAQGARALVGYFYGHLHKEYLDLAVDKVYGANFNLIACLASLNQVASDTGTINEDGWTVISLDTINKQCNLIGFGRATNRTFKY